MQWLDDLFATCARNPRRHRRGVLTMVAMSLAYTVVSINLAILGGVPVPPPFLAIPPGSYFFWASFFYAAALLAGWLFGAGFMQVVARALGGRGAFEDTLALAGLATAFATLPALLPDLVITFVQVAGWMDYGSWRQSVDGLGVWFWIVWAYLAFYIVAFVVSYPSVVRTVHGLAGARAWIAGIAGFAAYQGFVILFIR